MKRPLIIFLIALAALAGSLVALASSIQARNFTLRGYRDATLTADLPFWIPRLGVNAELTQYSPDEITRNLDLMRAANITWVRQMVRWDEIEPSAGTYDWERWDAIIAAFESDPSLKLIPVLVGSPVWAHPANDSVLAPPDDPADFANFTRAFAERYGHVVDSYQIWDEPNLYAAWGGEPRAADYLAMLSAAYTAIHAADSGAVVIAAALAPTTEQGPENISDWQYLDDLLALGGARFMDAAAAKPYGFDSPPEDRTVSENALNFSRIIGLREILEARHAGQMPLWASNWGWNALQGDWQGAESIWGQVSPQQQVEYTLAALDRAEREWPWLSGMILYHWQPDAPPDDPVWGFALINQNGQPGALYNAFTQRPSPVNAQNGLYFAANPFTGYSGVWSFSPLGADIGWIQDSQLDFQFAGQDISLLVREDNYVALLYATVDDRPANALPHDAAGNAYLLLTSDTLEPTTELIALSRGLVNGQHNLHIAADRGWDRWAIAGYGVSSGSLALPYERQISVAIFASIIALISTLVAGFAVNWLSIFSWMAGVWCGLGEILQFAIAAITSIALMLGMLMTWGSSTPEILRREPVQISIALAAAGILYLSPWFILALAAAFALLWIIYQRIQLGLMLVIIFAPLFLFPVEIKNFPAAELILLLTAVAWGLKGLASWGRARQSRNTAFTEIPFYARLHLLDWGVIAYTIIGVLAAGWSAQRGEALTDLRTMYLEPVLFYAILRTTARSPKDLLNLVDALILAGLLVSVIGLIQFTMGQGIITAEGGARRLASVYGSPNNVALLLERCLPFVLAFLLLPVDRARRIAAAIAFAIMLGTLLLTQSAGALFIGVPIALAVVVLLALRKRALIPLGVLIAAGIALFALLSNTDRFSRLLTGEGTSFFRVRLWESALQMLKDHPLTGVGLDQFLYMYRGQYIQPDAWQEPNLSHPHNWFLDTWLRTGIGGVLIMFYLLIIFFAGTFKAYLHFFAQNHLMTALATGAIGSMAALLTHGLVDNSIFVNDLVIIFMLLLGLAAQLSRLALPAAHQNDSTAKLQG